MNVAKKYIKININTRCGLLNTPVFTSKLVNVIRYLSTMRTKVHLNSLRGFVLI